MNGLKRLQKYLLEKNFDSIIIIGMSNLQYFSGFTGTTAALFVTPNDAYLITDGRYVEQASQQCTGFSVIQHHKGIWLAINNLIKEFYKNSIKNCAFEGNILTFDQYTKLTGTITNIKKFTSVTLESLRAVKRDDEIVFLKKAAEIADKAFAETLPLIKPGMSENDVRVILESKMLENGSSGPSFETIIASGYRSSMPHGVASDKIIEEGDFITFDFGAIYKGYHSDMTRTIVLGKASQKQKDLYYAVLKAQKLGVSSVKAGLSGFELDKIVRNSLTSDGYAKHFTHGLGHGVGLDIHELPIASPSSKDTLDVNMVVTVEPGIYFEGDIGLRIEDTVIVKENSCEIITKTSKELLELRVI